MRIITFNILAHIYTNYSKGSRTETESITDLKLRYITMYNILKNINADIYCLQEVDRIAKDFFVYKFTNYNYHFTMNNKDNGCLTLWKNKYPLIQQKKVYFSPKRKKLLANFVILNINGEKLLIINTKLWGEPANVNVREKEIKNIIKKIPYNKDISVILCGDFNETDYQNVKNIVPDNFIVYDEYFEKNNFATSYHEWNIHKITKKMYREPPHHMYKNIDYFIHTDNIIVENFKVLPRENGVYMLKEPYYNISSVFTSDKWVSDHALLIFEINILN